VVEMLEWQTLHEADVDVGFDRQRRGGVAQHVPGDPCRWRVNVSPLAVKALEGTVGGSRLLRRYAAATWPIECCNPVELRGCASF